MSYLDPAKFRIFAHRGLSRALDGSSLDENTIPAFQAALTAGADYLELDIQCSSDGVAVVFHDETLDRITNVTGPISAISWSDLQGLRLNNGGRICSLRQVLAHFPTAKLNIDVKAESAIGDLASAISEANATGRVLLTSFSEKRRLAAVAAVPGVATSASASVLIRARIAAYLGLGLRTALKNVNALQIPVSYGPMRLDSPRFIRSVSKHGVELHYWTINDPKQAKGLRARGAHGVVTDRTDLMIAEQVSE